ncbi:hypothetical protein KI387_020531, partial [Taxus chinensis]
MPGFANHSSNRPQQNRAHGDFQRRLSWMLKRACKPPTSDIPKGYVAVRVGTGNDQTRFVIPVSSLLNHPAFVTILEDHAQDEYGRIQREGILRIHCPQQEFLDAKKLFLTTRKSNFYNTLCRSVV